MLPDILIIVCKLMGKSTYKEDVPFIKWVGVWLLSAQLPICCVSGEVLIPHAIFCVFLFLEFFFTVEWSL
jgi:hypothetical protein